MIRSPVFCLALVASAALAAITAVFGLTHDSAIFLNAGLREWAGQTAYLDYYLPQGVVTGELVALGRWVLPNMGWTLIALSVGLNLGATLCIAAIVLETTRSQSAATMGAWLTALCYTPIMGTFYNDHLAYFLLLLGFLAIIRAPENTWPLLLAGALTALAFHTKQPVGLVGLGVIVLYGWTQPTHRFRRTGTVLLSHIAVQSIFLLSFWSQDSFEEFLRYGVEYPLHFAGRVKSIFLPFTALILPWNLKPWATDPSLSWGQLVFLPFALASLYALFVLGKLWRDQRTSPQFAALFFLTLSTLWSASLLGRLYAQLFLGAGGVVAVLWWTTRKTGAKLLSQTIIITSGLGALSTLATAIPVWNSSSYYEASEGLVPLRVREGGGIHETREIIGFLKDRPGHYALFCTQCYLVPLELDRAPVSPPVYFEAGLTFPHYRPEALVQWEDAMIEALRRNEVQWVVITSEWRHWKAQYPRLSQFLFSHYETAWLGRFHQILKPGQKKALKLGKIAQ